ncbi:hypothetical protein NT6N_35860 [Oceaniferula spumae]|uniref:Sialate O-acetylesterase domain-containing protein n=1 Tax=Oceaniferula spumae TaxID=2979115 RepID=A0AAT9FR92_9BACT
MKCHTHILFLLLLASLNLAQATHYKLFILTGQSNSLGTTNGGENDPSSGSDPSDQHVQFFWHNVVNASTTIGTSGGVFTTLQDQQGGVYAGSATHWGPEMEFARTLYRAGVRDFGVIKASRGGGGNSLWAKPTGHMYDHVVATVNAATAQLETNGHTFEVVGMLYLQGESDDATEAAAAGTRLKALTDNLRIDLQDSSSNSIAANMHTVIAGTTAQGNANDDTTRSNHAAIASSTSYIDYFDNLDQQSNLAPDNLHLNKAAKIVVGNRFAQTFLNSGIVDRHYGNLVFIGDSITQGGNGRPSYRYQIFKNLANAGVPIDSTTGYKFVGSISGAYQNNAGSNADVNGQTFENNHDGHWGWRAMWQNGRVPLPTSRRSGNRGEGTILNWTGVANPQVYVTDAGQVAFPDPTASGTGVASPYTPYTPDTASIMIGINETSVSSAAQIRDDIGTMIDQLRSSNPNIRIHLNQLLYSDNVAFPAVDSVNTLLPQLVADKNAESSTSPVWLVTANDGFVPSTHTYDNTHPNTAGEIQVGNIISGSLGIIEAAAVDSGTGSSPADIEEKASAELGCYHFEGSDIYNSGSFASNWTTTGTLTATPTGDSDLQLVHPGTSGTTLDGTNTGWSGINHGPWTFETRIKFNDISNGIIFWLGTGTHRILIEAYADRTQNFGASSFNVSHNNHDNEYHTYKVTHDPAGGVYHLWRDGVLLTPAAGAPYEQAASDQRLLIGDYTSGAFGNNFDVTIDYVQYCVGFKGNQIYDGTNYINGWSSVQTGGFLVSALIDTDDLRIVNASSGGTWVEGTGTGWSDNNDGNWTYEIRAKFDNVTNGFEIWLGTGTNIIRVQVYPDRTQDFGGNGFNVAHNNVDGLFHDFRIAHDAGAQMYHVFRDGERLTPIAGVDYDQAASEGRFILGDTTGGSFGDAFDVTIDCINIDYSGVWIPVGTDTDGDGLPDTWENTYFNSPTAGNASNDDDHDGKTNVEEYHADTDPNSATSRLQIESISETSQDNFDITVPNTSTQRNYTLYASDDLGITDPWTAVAGQGPVAGNGSSLIFTPSHTARQFYRVEVSLP